jgi:hypothetical protein
MELYEIAEKLAWDLKGKLYSDNGKFIVYLQGRVFEFSNIKNVVKFLEFTKKEVERYDSIS